MINNFRLKILFLLFICFNLGIFHRAYSQVYVQNEKYIELCNRDSLKNKKSILINLGRKLSVKYYKNGKTEKTKGILTEINDSTITLEITKSQKNKLTQSNQKIVFKTIISIDSINQFDLQKNKTGQNILSAGIFGDLTGIIILNTTTSWSGIAAGAIITTSSLAVTLIGIIWIVEQSRRNKLDVSKKWKILIKS
jgi:hypothetical protein